MGPPVRPFGRRRPASSREALASGRVALGGCPPRREDRRGPATAPVRQNRRSRADARQVGAEPRLDRRPFGPNPTMILLANSSRASGNHGFALPAFLILPISRPNDPP